MTIDNIPGRLAAIVTACALGAGGTSLLFGDVIFGGADFTQKHFQTICIVIATTTAWLAMTSAFKNRHIVAGLGFLVLALAGSCVIGWNSLGRQTEGQMLSSDDHDKAAEERGRLKTKLVEETKARDQKRREADAKCEKLGPDHKRCLGARAVEAVYADSVSGIEARLKTQQVKPADASAEAFGNITNAIGGNGTKAKAASMLVMPIIITILVEYGFTLAVHYVFRPSRRKVVTVRHDLPKASAPTQLSGVSDIELLTLRQQLAPDSQAPVAAAAGFAQAKSQRPNKDGGARTVRHPDSPRPTGGLSKQELLEHVQTELALGRSFPSQQAMAGLSGQDKRRVSEWVRKWEADGLIPARTQAGRCKSLMAG